MLFCQANIQVKQIQKNSTSLTEIAKCQKITSTYNQKSQSSPKVKNLNQFIATTILDLQIG